MYFEFANDGHVYRVDAWGFASRFEREGGNEESLRLRPKERLVLSVLVRSAEPVTEDALWCRVWHDRENEVAEDERRERIQKQIYNLRQALGSHIVKVDHRTYAIDAEVRRINQYHPPNDPHRHERRANTISARLMEAIFSRRSQATSEADHANEAELHAAVHALRWAGALRDELEQQHHGTDQRPSTEPSSVQVSLPASVIYGNGLGPSEAELALHEIAAIREDGKPMVLGYSSSEGPLSVEEVDLFVPRDRASLDAFLDFADIDPFHGIGLSSDGKPDAMLIHDGTGGPRAIVAKLYGALRLKLTPAGCGHQIPIRYGRDGQERSLPWQFSFEKYEYRASDDASLVHRYAGDGEADEIRLPRILSRLLALFLKAAGRRLFVLSGAEIRSCIWPGREYDDSARQLIREHVNRLNRKLYERASREAKPIAAGYQVGSYVLQSEVIYVADPLNLSSGASSLRYPVPITIPPMCSVVRGPERLQEHFEVHEVKAIRYDDGQPTVLGYAHDFEFRSIMHLIDKVDIGRERLLKWAGVVRPSRTKLVRDTDERLWFCAEETEERDTLRMVLVSSFNATLEWDRDDIPIPFRGLHRFFAVPSREPE